MLCCLDRNLCVSHSLCLLSSVTWVQARVLDREEIKALAAKVSAWSDTVRTTLDLVNATGAQLAHQQ